MAKLKVGIAVGNDQYIEYKAETYEMLVANAIEEKVLPNPATISDQIRFIQDTNKKLFKAGDELRFTWRLEYGA